MKFLQWLVPEKRKALCNAAKLTNTSVITDYEQRYLLETGVGILKYVKDNFHGVKEVCPLLWAVFKDKMFDDDFISWLCREIGVSRY